MKKYRANSRLYSGNIFIDDDFIGRGGEGAVYKVLKHDLSSLPEPSTLVAKIYYKPEHENRQGKVESMVQNPPYTSSVAWPLAVLYDDTNKFVGYIMVKLDSSNYRQWEDLSNANERKKTSPEFDVQYALTTCKNLALALDSVHKVGHMIGDINESNIFVGSDATIFIVDTDSAQIKAPDNHIFPCLVGKPEYTAPELTHGKLKDHKRTIASESFAYSIAIYQMLTGGSHPTDSKFTGQGEPLSMIHKIRQGIYPTLTPTIKDYSKPERIPSQAIPKPIQELIIKGLSIEPHNRPDFKEYINTIENVLESLKKCSKIKQHWYSNDLSKCPWCAHAQSNIDIWNPNAVANAQKKLPNVKFRDNNHKPVIKRAPAQVAGSPNTQQQSTRAKPPHNNNKTVPQQQPNNNYYNNTPPPAPQKPHKIKGKITVDYADGTYGVRPPISQLLDKNPKIAIYAIKEETPLHMRFWWSKDRKTPDINGLLISILISIGLSITWYLTIPLINNWDKTPQTSYNEIILHYASLTLSITSILACLILISTGYKEYSHTKKIYHNNLNNVKKDNIILTIIRVIPISIIYGPLLLLTLLFFFLNFSEKS